MYRERIKTVARGSGASSRSGNWSGEDRESPFVILAILAIAVAVLTIACGSSGDADDTFATIGDPTVTMGADGRDATPSEDGEEGEGVDSQGAFLDYAACMRAEGIDMPDPQFDAEGNPLPQRFGGSEEGEELSGPDTEDFEAANETCSLHLEGVNFDVSEEQQQEMQDAMLEFASCMREQGIDMPDPELVPADQPSTQPMMIDPSDPEVQAAMEVCEPLLRDAVRTTEENQP